MTHVEATLWGTTLCGVTLRKCGGGYDARGSDLRPMTLARPMTHGRQKHTGQGQVT